jgi:hypothetical protein
MEFAGDQARPVVGEAVDGSLDRDEVVASSARWACQP